ncbi:MAG TPA: hypothetical protein VG960_12315, partial [Caulobacteraceae bacterium]|nr:hypothetical protein [Caulobacteraceae bacterium]
MKQRTALAVTLALGLACAIGGCSKPATTETTASDTSTTTTTTQSDTSVVTDLSAPDASGAPATTTT